MAESIGDYFVNFFFKNDTASAKVALNSLKDLEVGYQRLSGKAFQFNEITMAASRILSPIRAIAASILDVGKQADSMSDFADAVGTSVDSIERMQYIGQLAGASAEAVTSGVRTLAKELNAAASGNADAMKTFSSLGVSIKNADGSLRQVGELMPEVTQAIAGLPNEGAKAQAAMGAFGKAGLDMLPMLKKSQEELAGLSAEFDALGGGFSSEFVKTSGEFNDNLDRSSRIFANMRREIASGVLPVVNRLLSRFVEWGKSNWPEIKSALQSFGDLLGKVFQNTAVDAIDSFLKVAAQIFQDKEKWQEMIVVFKAIGLAFAGWLIFNNPAVAVVGLFVGYMVDLLGMTQGKDSIFGRLTLEIRDFFDSLKETMPWLKKAIDYISYLNNLGGMSTDEAKKATNSPLEFGVGKVLNTLGGGTLSAAGDQQLEIKKRQTLEGLDPFRGKAALDAGLLNAKTGAEVDRIGNIAANVTINVANSPMMDGRALAQEIKRQVVEGVKQATTELHDNFVTEAR